MTRKRIVLGETLGSDLVRRSTTIIKVTLAAMAVTTVVALLRYTEKISV